MKALKTKDGAARRRVRKRRKVAKPKRPSKSLKSIQTLAKTRRWVAMATFKPHETINEITSNHFQAFLLGLLRRELRGTGIGFLLVREFGTSGSENDSGDRSHFHAVMTADLRDDRQARIKARFLRRCGLKNNQSRAFDYRTHTRDGEPKFGDYVSKLEKDGVDVIHPPSHWNFKALNRPYHSGYLNQTFSKEYMDLIPF